VSEIKFLYVAGAITPYANRDPVSDYWENIDIGVDKAAELLDMGYIPYCPHFDYSLYRAYRKRGKTLTKSAVYAYSMAWLRKCDAVLVVPKYRKSEGTKAEIAEAKRLGKPIFYNVEDLEDYDEDLNGAKKNANGFLRKGGE